MLFGAVVICVTYLLYLGF